MQATSKLFPSIVSKLFVSFLLCFALLLVSGCEGQGSSSGSGNDSAHPSALVGKWKLEEQNPKYISEIELLSDGTAIAVGVAMTWRVEDGRMYIIHPMGQRAGSTRYEVSGSTLTLTHEDGSIATYTKQR